MSENINFIPANELPVAEGDEVSVLCVENGEMKQKPAKGLGGSGIEIFDFKMSQLSSGQFVFDNMDQLSIAIDNNMTIRVVMSGLSSGKYYSIVCVFPNIKETMVFEDASGACVGSMYTGVLSSSENLFISLDPNDYKNGIFTPISAKLTFPYTDTLVKCYAAPF